MHYVRPLMYYGFTLFAVEKRQRECLPIPSDFPCHTWSGGGIGKCSVRAAEQEIRVPVQLFRCYALNITALCGHTPFVSPPLCHWKKVKGGGLAISEKGLCKVLNNAEKQYINSTLMHYVATWLHYVTSYYFPLKKGEERVSQYETFSLSSLEQGLGKGTVQCSCVSC